MKDRDLARLLSGRAEPSVLEKEAMLDRILTEVEPQRRSRRLRWLWAAPALAAAALWLLIPRFALDEFAARGPNPPLASFHVICLETGAVGTCPSGGTLAFEVDPRARGFIAVLARATDGRVIWYLPPADGKSWPLREAREGVLRHGIKLGSAQPVGRYEVIALLSERPLDRAEIRRELAEPVRRAGPRQVVQVALVVEPKR